MEETRKMVIDLLSQFRENQRRIELLRYEMEHPVTVSGEEIIDALAFGHADHMEPSVGQMSNKTLYIALNYQAKTQKENEGMLNEIVVQLTKLENQQKRLLYYIGLMEEHDAEIIRMTYMDGMDNDEIAAKFNVSVRTVRTWRAKAIDLLCEMYAYTASLQPNGTSA